MRFGNFKPPFFSVAYGVFADYLGTIINILLGFLAIPIYIQTIGSSEYGLWLAILSTCQLIALIDVPVDQFLTTVSSKDNLFNSRSYYAYLGTILIIKLLSAFLFVFASLSLSVFVSKIIPVSSIDLLTIRNSFLLVSGSIAINSLASFSSVILYSRNKHLIVNSMTNLFQISQVITTILCLRYGFSFYSFSLSMLLISLIQALLFFSILLFVFPHLISSYYSFSRSYLREAINYSLRFQNIRFLYVFRVQLLSVIINRSTSPLILAKYNITNRLPQFAPLFASKLALSLFPSVANLFDSQNYSLVSDILISATKLLTRFSIFFAVLILAFNQQFITLWVGSSNFTGYYSQLIIILNLLVMVSMSQFAIIIFASSNFNKWNKFATFEIFFSLASVFLFGHALGLNGILTTFFLLSLPTQYSLFCIVTSQLKIKKISFCAVIIKYCISKNIYVISAFIVSILIAKPQISWNSILGWLCVFIFCAFAEDVVRFIRCKSSDLPVRIRYAASL